jgi:uncharacterized protein (TIGR02996 family)
MTVAIVHWLVVARWSGAGALAVWQRLLGRLARLRDVRAIAPLRHALTTPPPFLGKAHAQTMASLIAATAEQLTSEARPGDEEGATMAAIEARLTTPAMDFFAHRPAGADALALLAPVWAAPDDLTVRQVVADALLERGEPWGEIIALSMRTGSDQERERLSLLLNKHHHVICGAIAKIAKVAGRVIEGGFLVECAANASMVPRRDWEAALVAPQWAMIRAVSIDLVSTPAWWMAAFATGQASRRVRRVQLSHYNKPVMVLTRETLAGPWLVERLRPYPRAERVCAAFVGEAAAKPSADRATKKSSRGASPRR